MDYKVLALDIDGTLVNSKKEISKPTLEALIDIQEQGYHVVLASGRPTGGMVKYADALNFDKYGSFVLSFNGARITDWRTKETIFNQTVPNNVVPELLEIAKANDVGMVVYKEGDLIIAGTEINDYMMHEATLTGLPIEYRPEYFNNMECPTNKCLMAGEPEILIRLEKELQKRYHGLLLITRSEPFFLEFMPMNVDKAHSLVHLMNGLGMNAEQLICCGDGFNDISMIEIAGLGVAMENAQDRVKAAADYVTSSNDDNGIVKVIEKFLKKI